MKNIVAMAANYSYIRQVETTIKSLLDHNSRVKIYLMNSDIPSEWFQIINAKLNVIGSKIVDKKVSPYILAEEHVSQAHIDVIASARFFIPELIREDTVVYLDSDVIVTDSLQKLFNLGFQKDELLAMAREVENNQFFNDGIVVFNNRVLKRIDGLTNKLLELGKNDKLDNGDQSVINDYFKDHIKELPAEYNYEIGMEWWAILQNRIDILDKLAKVKKPKIVHYASGDKPWNQFSSGRLRGLWWHYYAIDWLTIVQHAMNRENHNIDGGSLLTITNSQDLDHLEELVQALPEWHFYICAYTSMGWSLVKMSQYPNVTLYPNVLKYRLDELINKCDGYLDINYGPKDEKFLERFVQSDKPMMTFDNVKSNQEYGSNYHIFHDKQVAEMVKFIKEL